MAGAKKILIVDDEPDAVAFARIALSELGEVTILSAGDGEAGLAKAAEEVPDLIVLDVQMPGKDGFQVFADLKRDAATADIPVIMLTGVGDKLGIRFSSEDMGEFVGREPNAYIEKPVDPTELQRTASDLLGR